MGSVGSNTEIHHIMVNTTLDDCFEWFGGTVSAHHLICNNGGDDMFDADKGYIGEIEYLFGRDIEVSSEDPNGFEMDSNKASTDDPRTDVLASHVTMCGIGEAGSFGMVLRENLTGAFDDIAVTGFEYGVDARAESENDDFGEEDDANVSMTNAVFWGMEGVSDPADSNDLDFDEEMWFEMDEGNDSDPDPEPFDSEDCLEAGGPTQGVTSSGVGAFSDGTDDWHWEGLWISWDDDID